MEQRVFVFGTLKEGFPNFASNLGKRMPGNFRTRVAHPLYLVGDRHSPWLMDTAGEGLQVAGQVFLVDDETLAVMDRLERVSEPDGYRRREMEVEDCESLAALSAYVYVKPAEQLVRSEVRAGPLGEYGQEHAALYRSRTSSPNVVLSPAGAGDAEALVALRIAAMRESLERVGRFDLSRARERFLSGFDPAQTRHIDVDGKRVGFVVVKPQAGFVLLDHLYVHPDHQGRNIGAAVLAQVIQEARAMNLPIRVGALRESDSNRFYMRHGFQLVERGEFDNYYVLDAGSGPA